MTIVSPGEKGGKELQPEQVALGPFTDNRLKRTMTIKAQTYTFHCRFTSGARLPGYLGSTLRGALGWALKKTNCALRRQQCSDCLLREQCTYAWIFETERYRARDGRRVNARPHPFVLQPEEVVAGEKNIGDPLVFSLLLLDRANDLLPQIVYAVRLMGESGIGAGRRHGMGRFVLQQIVTTGRNIYLADNEVLRQPEKIERLRLADPGDGAISRLQVDLLTPLRLKQSNRMELNLPFHVLIRACLRRISSLEDAYGAGEPDLDYRGLASRAGEVREKTKNIRWQKLLRWSSRQRQNTSLSGLAGSIGYQGELREFLPILRYAEQVNIGKQTVFGLGKFRLSLHGEGKTCRGDN